LFSRRRRDKAESVQQNSDRAGAAPETVHEMVELEQRQKVEMTFSDRIADAITIFAGSMLYVWLHVIWFTIWVVINTPWLGLNFDPFPFGLLTMIVSLEAIFLSTFVLITQNRQALLSDKRAKLDLQVNLISESEVTKLLSMISAIHDHLGIDNGFDEEAEKMQKPTRITQLAREVEAVERAVDVKPDGPRSAADTEN
jgi:uncharacterized membrane protein